MFSSPPSKKARSTVRLCLGLVENTEVLGMTSKYGLRPGQVCDRGVDNGLLNAPIAGEVFSYCFPAVPNDF